MLDRSISNEVPVGSWDDLGYRLCLLWSNQCEFCEANRWQVNELTKIARDAGSRRCFTMTDNARPWAFLRPQGSANCPFLPSGTARPVPVSVPKFQSSNSSSQCDDYLCNHSQNDSILNIMFHPIMFRLQSFTMWCNMALEGVLRTIIKHSCQGQLLYHSSHVQVQVCRSFIVVILCFTHLFKRTLLTMSSFHFHHQHFGRCTGVIGCIKSGSLCSFLRLPFAICHKLQRRYDTINDPLYLAK